MMFWVFFAVVFTTALFFFILLKIKQKEIRSTQELLLQFIEQFEEQHQDIVHQFEKYKQTMDNKYELLIKTMQYDDNEHNQKPNDQTKPQLKEAEQLDPLLIKERYGSILQLHEEGKPIDEIARIVGKGKGEVLLVLELFGKQK